MQATRPDQRVDVFPDGKLTVYKVDKSKRKLIEKKGTLRFENRSVGIDRYYTCNTDVDTVRLDSLVKVPRVSFVDVNDIVLVAGSNKQFWVTRIQLLPERDVFLLELKTAVPKLSLALDEVTP